MSWIQFVQAKEMKKKTDVKELMYKIYLVVRIYRI